MHGNPLDLPQLHLAPCPHPLHLLPLGIGAVFDSAASTSKISLSVRSQPGLLRVLRSGHSTWAAVDRALDWMTTYVRCAGCRNGGGPPDCAIRICAWERGYERCSSCADLEGCTSFDWMGEYGKDVKVKLKERR